MKRSAEHRITGLCLALVITGCVVEGAIGPCQWSCQMLEDERHTNLDANLRAFEQIYEDILPVRPDGLDGFATAYYAYIGEQLAETRRQLAQLPLLRKDIGIGS